MVRGGRLQMRHVFGDVGNPQELNWVTTGTLRIERLAQFIGLHTRPRDKQSKRNDFVIQSSMHLMPPCTAILLYLQ